MTLYPFIEAEKAAGRKVKPACRLLEVSRSAYYQWGTVKQEPSRRVQEERELVRRIAAVHAESRGTYGAPRVRQALRRQGVQCSRKRVARLMAADGLRGRGRRRGRRTTVRDGEARLAVPNLLERRFEPGLYGPDQVWVGDISYVRTWEGWCYLASVIDLASRRVVGFATATHMQTSLVSEALTMAITSRRPAAGLIFHSDRGSQYTSREFTSLLERHGIVQSLSRVGQCWDNAVAESFFGTLKAELVYREPWPTVAAARRAIFEFIEAFYNRRRLHSALGYCSPAEYEATYLAAEPTCAA